MCFQRYHKYFKCLAFALKKIFFDALKSLESSILVTVTATTTTTNHKSKCGLNFIILYILCYLPIQHLVSSAPRGVQLNNCK